MDEGVLSRQISVCIALFDNKKGPTMRRKDREVTNPDEILDILRRCDTIRLGLRGAEYPYVVPLSFGLEVEDGRPVVYFHCAREGFKLDLLRQDPRVCVEGDIFIKIEPTDHGITTRYESVIGTGVCEILTDPDACARGLKAICDHYGYFDYDLKNCRALQFLHVGRIPLDTLTGKRNLPLG